MALVVGDVRDHIVSHAMTLGYFDRVNAHEPKNAPGKGLTCAVWLQSVKPVKETSGLATTSALVVFSARIMLDMLQEPQDDIDVNLGLAIDAYMDGLTGDFNFDGTVMYVDLLGTHGESLSCKTGYMDQDSKKYRVAVITIPVVVSDVWTQVA